MSVTTSFVIGSVEDLPSYDLSINTTPYSTTADDYYLWHASSSLSLCDHLQSLLASEVTGANVFITAAGYVRIEATQNFTIVWTDSELRDLFGFTAGVGPTQGVTATKRSPMLWIPGWPETPDTPIGTQGSPVRDTIVTMSATGLTSKFTTRHTRIEQSFSWRWVSQSRVWTTAEEGGEFRRFFDDHLVPGYRFMLHSGATETVGSVTEFTRAYTLGPYKLRPPIQHEWFRREDPSRDSHSPIDLPCVLVSEYV